MRRILLIFCYILLSCSLSAHRVIMVKPGDAQSLLQALETANQQNDKPTSKQLYILIPDGYYDLGDKVMTKITGYHIALIGQSTEGTIIRNAPDFKNEGINTTAVLHNLGADNCLQDLTLRNDLDYYACGAAGRGVALHDKGTRTVCNRVRMLSYQDTYYSWVETSQHYLKDTEIHGTVDFICGAGDVWFEQCRIVTEKRHQDGHGRCVIVAPRTSLTQWGHVFNGCTIENVVSGFDYARGWHTQPRCTWLNTTLLSPEKLSKTRFDTRGMRTVMSQFKEYGTKDASGHDITPASNVITLTLTQKQKEGDKEVETHQERTVETTLTPEEARQYTLQNVFGDWQPDRVARRIEQTAQKLWKQNLQHKTR